MMSQRKAIVVWLIFMSIALPGAIWGAAWAQEATEAPPDTQQGGPCKVGELCLDESNSGGTPFPDVDSPTGAVNDPPGAYARSLLTLAAIAVLVGIYLFIALTGKRLAIPLRGDRVS